MQFTSLEKLCPRVREVDRLVFKVQSRSHPNKFHLVDAESRDGLCRCNCQDATLNRNAECFHVQEVRKFITIKVVQAVLTANKKVL